MKRYLFILASVLLISLPSEAGNVTVTLSGLGCFEDGTCFLLLAGNSWLTRALNQPNSTPCNTVDQIRFAATTAGGSEMYKTAVSAYLAGRPLVVNIESTASSTACYGDYAKAKFIILQ